MRGVAHGTTWESTRARQEAGAGAERTLSYGQPLLCFPGRGRQGSHRGPGWFEEYRCALGYEVPSGPGVVRTRTIDLVGKSLTEERAEGVDLSLVCLWKVYSQTPCSLSLATGSLGRDGLSLASKAAKMSSHQKTQKMKNRIHIAVEGRRGAQESPDTHRHTTSTSVAT